MEWTIANGVWNPVLRLLEPLDQSGLINIIFNNLGRDISAHPIAFLGRANDAQPGSIRRYANELAGGAQKQDRERLDWFSAMCSELAPEATSQLQTARRDYFWGNLKSVMNLTERDHLRRTLFALWDYGDPLENQSLHLEPAEDRRHAHQWFKPSGDPTRKERGGMLGANRLAIEAFPLFQSIAFKDKLSTRGFSGNRSNNTRWTWPLWSKPVNLDVVVSLLASPTIQHETITDRDNDSLRAMGIAAAFRSMRILVGKTPNFTPAIPIL
ncbi:MAG: hypothetical protein HKL96_07135 [Phycisphaerales bacterium]|nr:hypothetical protein [Phycisphaerales bacterium]